MLPCSGDASGRELCCAGPYPGELIASLGRRCAAATARDRPRSDAAPSEIPRPSDLPRCAVAVPPFGACLVACVPPICSRWTGECDKQAREARGLGLPAATARRLLMGESARLVITESAFSSRASAWCSDRWACRPQPGRRTDTTSDQGRCERARTGQCATVRRANVARFGAVDCA